LGSEGRVVQEVSERLLGSAWCCSDSREKPRCLCPMEARYSSRSWGGDVEDDQAALWGEDAGGFAQGGAWVFEVVEDQEAEGGVEGVIVEGEALEVGLEERDVVVEGESAAARSSMAGSRSMAKRWRT
jgi:hypothetical protein